MATKNSKIQQKKFLLNFSEKIKIVIAAFQRIMQLILFVWRHDIQYNDIQHNDKQHNDIDHKDI